MSQSSTAREVAQTGFAILFQSDFVSRTGLDIELLERGLLNLAATAPRDDHVAVLTRFRRHDKLVLLPWSETVQRLPLPCYYRDLARWPENGRHYDSIGPDLLESVELKRLLLADFALCPLTDVDQCYPVEVGLNLIRIVATTEQAGVSPPNKPHQDGESFVIIHLLERSGVHGGESLVALPDETPLWRGTLAEPFDTLVVDDARLLHHVDVISTEDGAPTGSRTVLVVDFSPMRSVVGRS